MSQQDSNLKHVREHNQPSLYLRIHYFEKSSNVGGQLFVGLCNTNPSRISLILCLVSSQVTVSPRGILLDAARVKMHNVAGGKRGAT